MNLLVIFCPVHVGVTEEGLTVSLESGEEITGGTLVGGADTRDKGDCPACHVFLGKRDNGDSPLCHAS